MKIPYTLLDWSKEVKAINTQWDMAQIQDMLDGKMWRPAQGYEFVETDIAGMEQYDGGVFLIPARQNAGNEAVINTYLKQYRWALVILCGDEERSFDLSKFDHPNLKLWLMQPKLDDNADFYIGSGYTRHIREWAVSPSGKDAYMQKPLDWYFAGQINHERRTRAAEVLRNMLNREDIKGRLIESPGFTQGATKGKYATDMLGSKAIPCPSGIQSPDSFRVYEALEAGAIPVADDLSPVLVHEPGYWNKVFNGEELPFKVLTDYDNLEGYICDVVREFPTLNNKVFSWWQQYKRRMVYILQEHVNELSGLLYIQDTMQSKITVIIVTSPIKSHPSTEIIDQTIADMRKQLPDCEILIGIDGVRSEQDHYRERYEQYKQRLLWKCNNEWSNVLPVVFDEHKHQAAMTRQLLKMVKTPMLLFVEHDTALTPDYMLPWDRLTKFIETGDAYTIRFHFEAHIPEEHKNLMIDEPSNQLVLTDSMGVKPLPMQKTVQWSQRPHLSSTAFYRDIMNRFFTDDSRTMIEDKVHGLPVQDYINDGMQGWYKWRLWIYHPLDGNIKRSYTTDGRGDDPKYEMRF